MKILFGISIEVLWFSYFHSHTFISATGITIIYIIFVVLIYRWVKGELDKTTIDKLIKKEK